MNKMFFVWILFCTFQTYTSVLWSGYMGPSTEKIEIKIDKSMTRFLRSLNRLTEKIQPYETNVRPSRENTKVASEDRSAESFDCGVSSDDLSTFLYTKNVFQCVALGIVKFSDNNKIERFLFHLNFLNPAAILLKKREVRNVLDCLHGYRHKIALASAMYSENVYSTIDLIEGYGFKVTHCDIFPIWYPNNPVDHVSNGGSFYIVDTEDCNFISDEIDDEPPYVLPLKSNQHGWWGPKSLVITPEGEFHRTLSQQN